MTEILTQTNPLILSKGERAYMTDERTLVLEGNHHPATGGEDCTFDLAIPFDSETSLLTGLAYGIQSKVQDMMGNMKGKEEDEVLRAFERFADSYAIGQPGSRSSDPVGQRITALMNGSKKMKAALREDRFKKMKIGKVRQTLAAEDPEWATKVREVAERQVAAEQEADI